MKLLFYIDSMARGGAQRVFSVLCSYFCANNQVLLINDIRLDNEYEIDSRIKRIVLDKKSFFSKTNEIRRIVKKEKPDVVLSFLGPCNIRNILATSSLKCKTVVSVRNDPNYEYGKGIKKFIARFLFKLADGCVFQTEEAKQYFSKSIYKKSAIVFNPVGDSFFEHRWNCKREEIAFVGRLQNQKNPLMALEAFNSISSIFPDLKLVYYGDGELKTAILERAKEFNLDDRVVIKGNVSNLEEYLETSRAFLMTSNFEGMPNALMEAMTVGIPVVCIDCPCGGPRMLIENGKSGFLIKRDDFDSLHYFLRLLLSSVELQNEFSKNEIEKSSLFRKNKICQVWNSFFLNLLKGEEQKND